MLLPFDPDSGSLLPSERHGLHRVKEQRGGGRRQGPQPDVPRAPRFGAKGSGDTLC